MPDEKVTPETLYGIAKDQSDEYWLLYEYADHQVVASFGDCLYADAKNVRLVTPDGRVSDFSMPDKPQKSDASGKQVPDWGKMTSFSNHMYIHDMSVTLLGPDGSLTVVPLHEKSENLPENFAWARESFEKLTAEWDKIATGEERPLLDNFRQRGGILCLMQRNAVHAKIRNALLDEHEETIDDAIDFTDVQGEATYDTQGGRLGQNFDFLISLSTDRTSTTLLHELTHCADHGISESPIFLNSYYLDFGRGGQYTRELFEKMKKFEDGGAYQGHKVFEEFICRLNEERHADPERFKKECPILDEFYSKVFYPAVAAQTAAVHPGERIGSSRALDILEDNRLLSHVANGAPDEKDFKGVRELSAALEAEKDPEKKAAIQRSLTREIDQTAYVKSIRGAMDEFKREMIALQQQTNFEHRVVLKGKAMIGGVMPGYQEQSNDTVLGTEGAQKAASIREPVSPQNKEHTQPDMRITGQESGIGQPHVSNSSRLGAASYGGKGLDNHHRSIHRDAPVSRPESPKQGLKSGIDRGLISKHNHTL